MPTPSSAIVPLLSLGRTGQLQLLRDDRHPLGGVEWQEDGSILLTTNTTVQRLLPDGTPDRAFHGTGRFDLLFSSLGLGFADSYHAQALADGKILVSAEMNGVTGTGSQLTLLRLNADGSVDTTFGLGGVSVERVDPATRLDILSTTVLSDGKILVLTDDWDRRADGGAGPEQAHHIGMTRYLADGELDSSFGKNGFVRDGTDWRGFDAVVQADGKIVVAGSDDDIAEYIVARFNADGSRDLHFGAGGALRPVINNAAYGNGHAAAVAVQADGKIIVAGGFTEESGYLKGLAVVRLNADGSMDPSFGTDGVYNQVFVGSDGNSFAAFIHINDDGSILIGGSMDVDGTTVPAVARLHADGTLDNTFGDRGVARLELGAEVYGYLDGMSVSADGRILLSTTSGSLHGGSPTPVIGQFDSHGHRVAAFGGLDSATTGNADYTQGYLDQFLSPHLSVGAQGGAVASYEGAALTLARAGGARSVDHFTGGNGVSLTDGALRVNGVTIGTASETSGTLRVVFNDHATQALVDTALRGIAYQNTGSFRDGTHIKIDWTFSTDAGAAKVSTDVALHTADAPYWIDALLGHTSTGQSATELRDDLNKLLGGEHSLDLQFASNAGAAPFSSAEQAAIRGVIGALSGVIDLRSGGNGTKLIVHSSGELAAGEGMASGIVSGHGDVSFAFGSNAPANTIELLHNLEHMLGLKHADLPGADDHANLTLLSNGGGAAQGLGVLDVAALQFLYGPSNTERVGDDTYQLSASETNFIWDGAGSDTISAAGLAGDLTLHLEPGHWDYIGAQGASITAAGQVTVNYGSVVENAVGGSGNDQLTGSAGVNKLSGGAGADRLTGLGGDDVLDGGGGIDTAVYAGKAADYLIVRNAGGWTVSDGGGKEGTDRLSGIEHLRFSDVNISLDIDGGAAQVYRLYQAAFDRAPDLAGLGFWMTSQESGVSLHAIADQFQASDEFMRLYGAGASDEAFVTRLYNNVLHRAPDAGGLSFWLGHIRSDISRSDAVIGFSESAENVAALIGKIEHGIAYTL